MSNLQVSCIRDCLIKADRYARENAENLTGDCCMRDSVINNYPEKCYSGCGVDPAKYKGVGIFGNGEF